MSKRGLTDDEVEQEIEVLRESPLVKLGEKYSKLHYIRRQRLYQLRWLEKQGRQLTEMGITMADVDRMLAEQRRQVEENDIF